MLLKLVFVVALLGAAGSARAQYGGSNYSIERWSEDWSYLRDVSQPKDPFDALKFIPLDDTGDAYASLGGQARYRYDYFNNTGFGAGRQDENGWHLARFLAHADFHFGPNFRAFVQVNSGLEFGRDGGPRPGDADDADVQQAFFDVRFPFADEHQSLLLRVGRQELIYGAQRLISPNDWGNVRRTFDGVRLSLELPHDTLDAFWVRPVTLDKHELNGDNDRSSFAGVYNVSTLPGLIPGFATKLDLYLLALNQGASAAGPASDTYTLGIHPHAVAGPLDIDLELDWQLGRTGDNAINAYSIAAQAGYTFTQLTLTPRLWLGFDLASGSADPGHRFNQLFPPLYLYLGHAYLFGRENLIDLHPGVSLTLTRDIVLSLEQHFFWRQNRHDALYNLSGDVVRSGPSDTATAGNEFDAVINWQIDRHTSAYVGYAHFFAGSFIEETGAHSGLDFLYAAMTFTF